MDLWQIKRNLCFPYTREQRKAMAGKIEMTSEIFWGCVDVCYCRCDNIKLRWLMKTYPQYMREFHEDYERRLKEDPEFRVKQEAESRRSKELCRKEFGEEWLKEHWSGD